MTLDDFYMCKYCTIILNDTNGMVPACELNQNIPCEDVLQYGDEGCKYERGDNE